MIRSEVVRIHRYDINHAMPGTPDRRIASNLLSEMCPEIKVGETKSVRISVEIVDENEEEKVGSKVTIRRHEGGARGACMNAAGGWEYLLEAITKDWQPGESRKVKSINFETPSGVPEVEFVETPMERLKRAKAEAFNKEDFESGYSVLFKAVTDYLAATEEAAKKGGQ